MGEKRALKRRAPRPSSGLRIGRPALRAGQGGAAGLAGTQDDDGAGEPSRRAQGPEAHRTADPYAGRNDPRPSRTSSSGRSSTSSAARCSACSSGCSSAGGGGSASSSAPPSPSSCRTSSSTTRAQARAGDDQEAARRAGPAELVRRVLDPPASRPPSPQTRDQPDRPGGRGVLRSRCRRCSWVVPGVRPSRPWRAGPGRRTSSASCGP